MRWLPVLSVFVLLAACGEPTDARVGGEVEAVVGPEGGDPSGEPGPEVPQRAPEQPAEEPPAEEPPNEAPPLEDPPAEEDDPFNTQGQCCDDEEPEPGEEPPVEDGPAPSSIGERCFGELQGDLGPDYDQFEPVVADHCQGTHHQDIRGVRRVVFLGDSVTVGTPPTMLWDYYWVRLADMLKARFGDDIELVNCAKWGARTDDLLEGKREIAECFPDGSFDKPTLVIITVGGNDIAAWAQDRLTEADAMAAADHAAELFEDAVRWLKDPARFPNGMYVVYANPYEYTDATGDLASCPFAGLAGLEGNWIEGAPAVIYLHERFMQIAVETGSDMIFTLEHFCGHGFHRDDPESQCYRGPNAELWFDLTCIHPNPAGHAVIASMFDAVVGG